MVSGVTGWGAEVSGVAACSRGLGVSATAVGVVGVSGANGVEGMASGAGTGVVSLELGKPPFRSFSWSAANCPVAAKARDCALMSPVVKTWLTARTAVGIASVGTPASCSTLDTCGSTMPRAAFLASASGLMSPVIINWFSPCAAAVAAKGETPLEVRALVTEPPSRDSEPPVTRPDRMSLP